MIFSSTCIYLLGLSVYEIEYTIPYECVKHKLVRKVEPVLKMLIWNFMLILSIIFN